MSFVHRLRALTTRPARQADRVERLCGSVPPWPNYIEYVSVLAEHCTKRGSGRTGMSRRLLAFAVTAACGISHAPAAAAAPIPCAQLASLSLPDTMVTAAEEVPAGAFTPPVGAPQAN